jgi:hypothetical protein
MPSAVLFSVSDISDVSIWEELALCHIDSRKSVSTMYIGAKYFHFFPISHVSTRGRTYSDRLVSSEVFTEVQMSVVIFRIVIPWVLTDVLEKPVANISDIRHTFTSFPGSLFGVHHLSVLSNLRLRSNFSIHFRNAVSTCFTINVIA